MKGILTLGNIDTIHFQYMTCKLHPGIYEIFKIKHWCSLIQQKQRPIEWSHPNTLGTIVYVSSIESSVELIEAKNELSLYIEDMNCVYGFNLMLQWGCVHEVVQCVSD